MAPLTRRIHAMGLLPRLLIAEALVFVFVFTGGILLTSYVANSLRDHIRHERLLLGRAIAEDLDASLAHTISALRQLAEGYRLASSKLGPEEFQGSLDLLAQESRTFTRGIAVVGSDGRVLAADSRHPGWDEIDLQRYWPNLWNLGGQDSGGVAAAGFKLEGQASPTVAIAVPVGGGHPGTYAVGLADAVNSYPAQVVARAVRLGGTGHADIVDERGVDLFTTEPEHLLSDSDHPASYRRLFNQNEAAVLDFPQEEEQAPLPGAHLMAFVPLRTLPWAVAVGTTVSDAFAPARQLWYASFGFLALLTGLAFLGTVFVGQQLVRPVRSLSTSAKRVASGDRDVTVRIPWGGEIGELGASLETMRRHLESWGSEMEKAVHERTMELEGKHQELTALYEALQRSQEQLRALLGKVLTAQEDERRRVSRELHDGMGQAFSAISMGLERLAQDALDHGPDFRRQVEELKGLSSDCLDDLRRLVIALRPAALDDLGLVPAIRRYCELYLALTSVEIQEEGRDTRLDSSMETIIYRVVQEAINNVARHSAATRVRIRLSYPENRAVVTVEDNGRGFDPALLASHTSFGIQGMKERATLAGGSLAIETEPDGGTRVRLEIPLRAKAGVSKDAQVEGSVGR